MTGKKERYDRAARELQNALDATGDIHITDMGLSNLDDLSDLREDMQGWVTNLERWAEEAGEEE